MPVDLASLVEEQPEDDDDSYNEAGKARGTWQMRHRWVVISERTMITHHQQQRSKNNTQPAEEERQNDADERESPNDDAENR